MVRVPLQTEFSCLPRFSGLKSHHYCPSSAHHSTGNRTGVRAALGSGWSGLWGRSISQVSVSLLVRVRTGLLLAQFQCSHGQCSSQSRHVAWHQEVVAGRQVTPPRVWGLGWAHRLQVRLSGIGSPGRSRPRPSSVSQAGSPPFSQTARRGYYAEAERRPPRLVRHATMPPPYADRISPVLNGNVAGPARSIWVTSGSPPAIVGGQVISRNVSG